MINLTPGRWWGWIELPARHPGWSASPILLTAVEPLKTGKGVLRLAFVHALQPRAAVERVIELRVLLRAADHLVGTYVAEDGSKRTAAIARADYAWLSGHLSLFFERFPPEEPTLFLDGKPLGDLSAEGYLADRFGADRERALTGATKKSFGSKHPALPSRTTTISLDALASPFDSWLISRGHVPKVMEDKWFIHMDGMRLVFRRSWTGIIIYELRVKWQDDRLHLGKAKVNRDPGEYGGTNDEYDRKLLMFLIDVLLCGVPHDFPHEDDNGAGNAAIKAWSVAGKFSL